MKKCFKRKTPMAFFRRKSLAIFMALIMLLPSAGFGVSSPPATTGVANRPGAIKTGKVDMASGNLAFVENIFSLKGYKLTLKYNTEGIVDDVISINGDKPTGVVGLGWKLSKDRIVRLTHQTANTVDDEYLLNAHGKISKLTFEYESGDTIHFRLHSNPYWKILFLEAFDQWIVQKENGNEYIYGDGRLINHTAQSTEKGVAWGNWIGSSVESQGQRQFSVGWNLSAIDNMYGERVKLFYDQTRERVGQYLATPAFTKATYLKKVIGMDGNFIELSYEDKESREYEDPHTENTVASEQRLGVYGPSDSRQYRGDNDAFQERFETKYLKSVIRKSYALEVDRKVEFEYALAGTGQLTKRMLTEIQYMNDNGSKYQPSKKFAYFGSSDGVRVGLTATDTQVFSNSNGALYGALKSITIPGGGTYIYKYGEETIGGSDRNFDIPFPAEITYTDEDGHSIRTGWKAPKLFFMSDYVVVLHELNAHDRKLTNVSICSWVGDRWVYQNDFGTFEGLFFDRYHAEDYHEKNIISTIKNALLSGLSSNIPALGGLMNAFNDAITDDMNNLYTEITDLANGDVGGAIRDFFVGNYTIIRDVVEDIFASMRDEFENLDEVIPALFGVYSHENSERDLAEREEQYAASNPRLEYHISMQKDFFALTSSHAAGDGSTINQDVHIFERDPLIEGKWGISSFPIMVSSKYIDLQSGSQFVTLFDECLDVLYTFTRHRYKRWPGSFHRINQVLSRAEADRMSRITAEANNDILNAFGQMEPGDKDYLNRLSSNKRSAISARNNFIIVATSEADGANGRIQMFHHNKNRNWNWTTPAEHRFDKTLLPQDVPDALGPMAQGLAGNALLQLKAGNSIASLQVYDNMNTEAYNDVLQLTTGGVGSTDGSTNALNPLSTIQSDLVQDLSAMNATYGIVWDENMSNISVELLHVGVGQTGIKTFVNGNAIQKVGKAYSLIIGASEYDDNGINYAFRYNGARWITQSFPSDYFTSAMAPDVASQMVESSNKAYKTPKFQQYNANRPIISLARTHTQQGSIRTNSSGDLQGYTPVEIATNIPTNNMWSEVTNASQERIQAPEFIKEAIHLATDIINLVIQVIMMIIPFAQELAIAEEVISIIDKIVQVAGLAAMIIQPAADAMVDRIMGVNHKSTSIANNYLSTNGKLFARTPNGSWTDLGRAFDLPQSDKLLGINNTLSNGYYNYTVKRDRLFADPANQNNATRLQNYVTILKNRKIYKTIPFNQYVGGRLLLVRKDSLTMTGGSNAFVSYGPSNDDGYVQRNPLIIRTEAQNREQRRRKMSYEDSKIVRLHRLANNSASGALKDYVVKSVETSTGYESTYMHYDYNATTATYHDGHGAAIYPEVKVIPSNSATAPTGVNPPYGSYKYYFFNAKNFFRPGADRASVGLPAQASAHISEPLVTYHSFDHRDTADFRDRGVKILYGRQYMMEVTDFSGTVKSRQIDCHKIFAHDFFHRGSILELDHVYQPLSSVRIKMLDGVETKMVNKYTDEYRATLLRTVEHHSTSVTGEPEIHYTSKRYAFEHYPELLDQNRLHEVCLVVDSVRKGDQVYTTDATVTDYTGDQIRDLWLPYKVYKANLVDDIVDPSVENYQAAAARDLVVQDGHFEAYGLLMEAYELEIGNYNEAFKFVVSACDATKNTFDQVRVTRNELINAQHQIERTTADLAESNREIDQAKHERDSLKNLYDAAERNRRAAQSVVNDKYNAWKSIRHKRDIVVPLAFATGGPLAGGIAYKVMKDKVDKAYNAWQDARASLGAAVRAARTADDNLRSARDVLASLSSEHASVVRAITLARTQIHNAIDAYEDCYDASTFAHDAAVTAITISSFETLGLTDHTHRVSVHLQDTSVINHRDYLTESQRAITALEGINRAISNARNTNVYSGVARDARSAIAFLRQNREAHQTHIDSVLHLKLKHQDLLTKVARLQVKERDFQNFSGGIYKWYEAKTIKARDQRTGMPISIADGRNVVHSSLLDRNSRFAVATATDADFARYQAFYSGFEDYEEFMEYNVQSIVRTVSLRDYVTRYDGEIRRGDAHTGDKALSFRAGSLKLFPSSFSPSYLTTYADTAYVVSAYVKAQPGSRVWVGADTLSYANAPDHAKNDPNNRGWQYIEGLVIGTNALVTTKKPTLHIENAYSGVLIDDMAVRPLSSKFEATVYNNLSLPIAKIDNNGLTKRMYYDSHHRLQTVIDDNGRIYGLNLAAFSRDITDTDEFVQASPNEATKFSFIDYGKLIRTNSSNERRGSVNPETSQAAISFKIYPDNIDRMHLNFRIGSYNVDFHDGALHISHDGRDKIERLYSNVPEDWTFAQMGEHIFLWINGKRMDQYWMRGRQDTDMQMTWSLNDARMGDIVVGKQPVFKVDFTNGVGQIIQTAKPYFTNEGYFSSSIYSAMLYDGWGHKAVTTLPMMRVERELLYRPNAIQRFDWSTDAIMTGEVADFYTNSDMVIKTNRDQLYPYFRTFYENSPISRILKTIKPGFEFHGPIDNATFVDYQGHLGQGLLSQFGLSDSDFSTKRTRSSLLHNKIEVKDKMGRKVLSKKGSAISKSVNDYTATGYKVDSLMSPNHFDSFRNTTGSMFSSSHAQTDMMNNISVNESPDRGRVELIKDQLGRNIFIKTASSSAAQDRVGEIKYYQYDEQGRVITQGIYNSRWDKARLNTLSKSKYWFDTDVEWVKSYKYDIDDDSLTVNNKGRITRTLHNTREYLVQSDFDYNVYGQIIANKLKLTDKKGKIVSESTVRYEYYPSGQVKKITYPNGFELKYTFNRSGKIKGIGTPSDWNLFATYRYDSLDRLESQTRDSEQYYSTVKYDFRGRQQVTSWQNASSDTIFKQKLSFFNAGRYYDTKISRINYSGSMYTNIQHDYFYDDQDRLSMTNTIMNQNTNLEARSSIRYSYDRNSNLLAYSNTAGESLSLAYRSGTNQDLVANDVAYNADGLKTRFESGIWGINSRIGYNRFTNKPEVIHKNNFSDVINTSIYYKLSCLAISDRALTVDTKANAAASDGDKLTYVTFADSDNQLFRFAKVGGVITDRYHIIAGSNDSLYVHYDESRGTYLAPPSEGDTRTDVFEVRSYVNEPNIHAIRSLSPRRILMASRVDDTYSVGFVNQYVDDNVKFRFIPVRNTLPQNDFVWFNYDAKNNRVMKIRDLHMSDSSVKQDTLIYIHGNNRLPLTEFFYGTTIGPDGNETKVRKVSNYIYGPDFGSIGMRVFELDPESTTDPFSSDGSTP